MKNITATLAAAVACATIPAQAQAQTSSSSGWVPAAMTVALQEIYQTPSDSADFRPVVVVADGITTGELTVFDTAVAFKSRARAREEQLAWFVYLSKLEALAEGLSVSYWKPYNGGFGTVTLKSQDGAWVMADHKSMHSSSGARYFYGELYDGAECRDGSEMARRWNGYIDALDAMKARRPRLALADLPTRCPGAMFPDVAAYQQARKLGLIKP